MKINLYLKIILMVPMWRWHPFPGAIRAGKGPGHAQDPGHEPATCWAQTRPFRNGRRKVQCALLSVLHAEIGCRHGCMRFSVAGPESFRVARPVLVTSAGKHLSPTRPRFRRRRSGRACRPLSDPSPFKPMWAGRASWFPTMRSSMPCSDSRARPWLSQARWTNCLVLSFPSTSTNSKGAPTAGERRMDWRGMVDELQMPGRVRCAHRLNLFPSTGR